MIAQHCPKCGSSRTRRGYRDTPLLLRAIGIYRLLCENCNLVFVGFALPGTVPARGSHRARRRAARRAREGKRHGP